MHLTPLVFPAHVKQQQEGELKQLVPVSILVLGGRALSTASAIIPSGVSVLPEVSEEGKVKMDVAGRVMCRDCASLAQERLSMRMHSRHVYAHGP